MNYNVPTNAIEGGVLYVVAGQQSVTYNSNTYITSQNFRGLNSITGFTYSGTGTTIVNEVGELYGGSTEFEENSVDLPLFPEITLIKGLGIEFELNTDEEIVRETTIVQGFAIELEDYPYYAFQIIETRY